MLRHICIHGHFYQPPRENPWTGKVEREDCARPFHDWNERVTAECYARNAGNYDGISFDFGPTLLSWLELNAPEVYRAIIAADARARAHFGGHGPAIAHGYNHVIMPLASPADKETQVRWGIRDFARRFGREPEGMWLPETAVDNATLDVLARFGIRFTILAPHQARRVRRFGRPNWLDVRPGLVRTTIPYLCRLPTGREIAVFFYDRAISQEVSFGSLLASGEGLAMRLRQGPVQETPALVSLATDGETFGHHRPAGEKALAECLAHLRNDSSVRLTVYGEFLERFPPTHEVEIVENTSWSCSHGIERWRADCGCHVSGGPDSNQAWRAPLRAAMDWLRDELAALDVKSDRGDELRRSAQAMYTSCGWFFDDISGLEAVIVLRFAARAIELARELSGRDLEPGYLSILERAESNRPEFKNGAEVYRRLAQGSRSRS